MEFKHSLLLAVLVTLGCGGLLFAQEGTGRIEGQVTKEGEGVGGVTILVNAARMAEITEQDGTFAFDGVPVGSYTVVFTFGENSEDRTDVRVAAGETTRLDLEVDWEVGLYETLTVYSASRRIEKIVDAPAAVSLVGAEQIEREASHGQLPKVLEFTPGAEVSQSGIYDFNFNTRGFNSSLNRRVASYLDGRDTAAPFLGAQEWSAMSFPLDDLANMEFLRGPSAALFGANSSSGVLNMTSKAPRDSQGGMARLTIGELSTDNLDVRWADEIGGGWYYKLIGSIRETGDFTVSRAGVCQGGPIDNEPCNDDGDCDGGVCLLPEVEYSERCPDIFSVDCLHVEAIPPVLTSNDIVNTAVRFDKYFADNSSITMEGGWAEIEGPVFQTGIGRVQTINAERPWARVSHSRPHWNVLAYYSRRDAEQRSLQSAGELFTDTKKWSIEAQTNWDFADQKGRVVIGAAHTDEDIDTLNPRTGEQSLIYERVDSDRQAVFGQFDWRFNEQVKIVLAGRVDENTLHDTQFSPKAAVVYSVVPNHTLRFTYNEAFQVANYSEFFLNVLLTETDGFSILEDTCNSVGVECGFELIPVFAVGRNDLDVEETKGWEVGYSAILANRAFLTVDYYNAANENFITDLLAQTGTPLGPAPNNHLCTGPGLPDPCCTGLQTGTCEALNPNVPIWVPEDPAWDEVDMGFSLPNVCGGDSCSLSEVLFNSFAFLGAQNGVQATNDANGSTILVARSYTNFGEVDTQGVDVGLNYYISDALNLQFSYSWFDFEPQVQDPELAELLLANTPEHKFSLGLGYAQKDWEVGLSGRWVDEFRWSAGIFGGNVESYSTVDLRGSYTVTDQWKLGLNVANLFDNEDNQTFGGDVLGRRALASLTLAW